MSMLIDGNSCEALLSELDLFSVPSTQASVQLSPYKQYFPVNAVSGKAPLEFHITGGEEDYLDLYNSFLYLKCSIRKGDGSPLPHPAPNAHPADETYVYPINYFASTQFKGIEVYLNGVQISTNDNLYAYRSFLETELTYGSDAKNGFLQCSLFYQDTKNPDLHDKTIGLDNCVNTGARMRFLKTRYSKEFEMMTKIHSPIFQQSKLLINKMDLRVKFVRQDPVFCLLSFTDTHPYSVAIDKAVMYVKHKKVSESVRDSIESALASEKILKYPLVQSELKYFTRPAHQSDLSEYNIITGYLPKVVVVGLVLSKAFNGHLSNSPLNFANFDLENISLRKNGEPLPFQNIECNFSLDNYVIPYITIHQSLGRLFSNNGTGFGLEEYKTGGLTLYAFDLTQDGEGSDACHTSIQAEGSLDLLIKLREPQGESVTIILYSQRDGLLEIDKDRNVSFE